jgi:prophage tail gpP-like protein
MISQMIIEQLTLTLSGFVHTAWDSYRVESDIFKPADLWDVRVCAPDGIRQDIIKPGAPIKISIGPLGPQSTDILLTGRIDRISDKVARGGKPLLTLHGRDMAGVLVDCSAPIFSARLVTLSDIVAKVIAPLGVSKVRIEAGGLFEKVNVEPGDTAWQALQNAAEANGVWPWMEADGTLVVGGPRYDLPPVATLIARVGGLQNNCESVEELRDLSASYSEVTVLAQSYTGADRTAQSAIKAVFKDPSVGHYRPKLVVDHECTNQEQAANRARKLQQDSRLKSYTLKITVAGHRIDAPGQPGHGKLWAPGQRVHVISERHGLDAPFFLIARTCSGGRNQPSITELILKEDGMWITQVHAHSRRHRRGKTSVSQKQIIDLGSMN